MYVRGKLRLLRIFSQSFARLLNVLQRSQIFQEGTGARNSRLQIPRGTRDTPGRGGGGAFVAQLPEPRSLTNSREFFISISRRARYGNGGDAPVSRHETLRHPLPPSPPRARNARRRGEIRKSHTNRRCTPVPCRDSQSGISRNFL